ncbi:MAG TPA: GNAT family N-acetyltransferase [Alphaproteobacteria bacterium]|nr:GNAT family N-acetyltransferase [Alphaproteobacteria bacterium]
MTDQPIAIVRARPAERDDVAALFDRYRVFYEQRSDIAAAQAFIGARLQAEDSAIFLARRRDSGDGLGFVQLYPSFSSVSMRKIWILNDLYVAPEARRHGVGRLLMDRARGFARETGALRLELTTARSNAVAQALYRERGYAEDEVFLRFSLTVD